MADSRRVQAIVESYSAQRDSLTKRITLALLGLWLPFNMWHKPDMVHARSRRSSMIADQGVQQARLLARAFATEMLREADALPDSLPPVEERYSRSNVDIEQVYARPARQRSWSAHQQRVKELERELEDDVDDAVEEAEEETESFWDIPDTDELPDSDDDFWTIPDEEFQERMQQLIEDDISQASNDEILRTYRAAPKVTGYRRIIHPELSASGSCGLCIVASTRMYYMEDLAAMHGHCKCTVMPVTKDDDPGFTLSQDDLKKFYRDAGSTSGADLLKTRYRIEMHGELGPRLVREQDNWRGTEDVNRTYGRTVVSPWQEHTKKADKEMWLRSMERAQEFNARLARQKSDPSMKDALEVANIDEAMEYNRAFIAYARKRAA